MSDPEAARLLAEASLAGFGLIRYMLETETAANTADIAEKVLQYQAEVAAAHGAPGDYEVSVTPEQVLLYAQLANMAAASFTAMCQVREDRVLSKAELSAELARYQEMLLLGGSL